MKLEVIQAYSRIYQNPIAFSSGDRVQVGKRDPDNPEWIWCVGADDREGWVHQAFLEMDADGSSATGKRDYSALELSVTAGEELTGLERVGGWWLARNELGEVGWIPLKSVLEPEVYELLLQIETVFANVTKEDGVGLRESAAIDAGVDSEQDRALDIEQRWQDLSDVLIEEHPFALTFTDQKGYRFLLPAFMRYALIGVNNPRDDFAGSHAFSSLCWPGADPEFGAAFYSFTPEEIKVIARFVRFFDPNPSEGELEKIQRWERLTS